MLNKVFIGLGLITIVELHVAFQPSQVVSKFDETTQVVINEYESACIRKTIKLSGEFYTCKDLKKYLAKRGYDASK